MSEESIENITKSGSLFAPTFVNHYVLPDVNFNGHCLINDNIFLHKKVINMYVSCILNQWPRDLNTDFTLGNCLFWFVKLTNNVDPDKYVYTGYGIRFNLRSVFIYLTVAWKKMSLFLELIWAHLYILMYTSVYIDARKRFVLSLL